MSKLFLLSAEEAIKIMEQRECCRECVVSDFTCKDCDTAFEMAIKALEQGTVLDKVREEIVDTLYVDSLIFGELIDFRNGKISSDDVIDEFNRVTRMEVLKILDKHKLQSEE